MSRNVQLNNYSDFDRLLLRKNFLVTLIGSALAFGLSYFQLYIPLPVIPYNLSLALGVMLIVAALTKNIASSAIVALVGSIGILAPDGGAVDFILPYIALNLLLILIVGLLSDRLQLVINWVRFYLGFAFLFLVGSLLTGYLWYPHASDYNDSPSIDIGTGNGLNTGYDIPILDLVVGASLVFLLLIFAFILRGQILLDNKSSRNYRIIGFVFFVLGQLVTAVPLLLYSLKISRARLLDLAPVDSHLDLLEEVFLHGSTFGTIGTPVSIFLIVGITTTFTCIGIALMMVGKHEGNLEGTKGGSEVVMLAAPLGYLLYFIFASETVQTIFNSDNLYISIELFPVFASVIWIVYYLNQLAARTMLFIADRL